MIFVTVGSFRLPFDRLIDAAGALATGSESVVVQFGGSCVVPPRCIAFDFLSALDFERHVRQARVVVAHAGVGSAASCLRAGKRPILVPRLRALGENIDDHQIEFARRLQDLGLAVAVEDVSELAQKVETHRGTLDQPIGLSRSLCSELVSFVDEAKRHKPQLAATI